MNAGTAGFFSEVSRQLGAGNVGRLEARGREIRYMAQGSGWRYETLLQKEPETIEWIDSFRPGETLWDIGANVGIYSVYAGVRGTRVHAFEPHFANYYQLCINIGLNGLQDRVTPLCLALTDRKAIAAMNLASVDFGTSMSSFGEALDFRGNPYAPAFRQGMVGQDIDSLIGEFGMAVPNHVKIDVDGIELPIVRGAAQMLAREEVKSVSIELIETDAAQVDEVTEILAAAGLQFQHKKQNAAFATPETRDVLNYLFRRDAPATSVAVNWDPSPADVEVEVEVDVDAVVAGIVGRIAEAPIDAVPSENIYLEEVFPADLYAQIVARLPADDVLDPIVHPDAVAADGRITRRLLDLTEATLGRIAPQDRAFWQAMTQICTHPALAAALVDKFGKTLRARFGEELPELVAVPLLYRDFPGYRIGIHPDAASKIATLQFYLPADESQRHLGTRFHTRTPQGFADYKTNDFKPNAAYSFVRSEESWHSVGELGPQEHARNTLALTFYIKGQEYRSEPDMMMGTPVAGPASAPAPLAASIAEVPLAAAPTVPDAEDYVRINRRLRDVAARFARHEDVARLIPPGSAAVALDASSAFSRHVLDQGQAGYLFTVGWSECEGEGARDEIVRYKQALLDLDPYRERNSLVRMGFADALEMFDPETLDFIHVDACLHESAAAAETLLADWFARLRPGCIFAGNGYGPERPDIVAAIDALVAANGLELHRIDAGAGGPTPRYSGWFVLKPE
ncbi:FkbM family methyltransferase [Novosphingobium sp. KA1]|uniref:FkbM family methyltransferase n=1 Tax=Novosphingobium sp. (strain KA1) TaxID=164608 RepID=UPI001A8F4F1B|nr:FkbM family methyltransferase [Novosphingobium sp. KA1]QSR19024.1 hypothetical protein CA833_17685 [Novosphingobium sp. KA1]